MNLMKTLTLKNLKLNRKRTIVTIVGIILATALLSALVTLVSSFQYSMIEYQKQKDGDFHVKFSGVKMSELSEFKNNRNIESTFETMGMGFAKLNGCKNEDKPYAYVMATDEAGFEKGCFNLIEGRMAKNEDEIVIPRHLKTNGRIDIKVGDEITLDIGKRYDSNTESVISENSAYEHDAETLTDTVTKHYKVVGIMERPGYGMEDYSAAGYTFVTYSDELAAIDNGTKSEKSEADTTLTVYSRYTQKALRNKDAVTADIIGVDEKLFEKANNSSVEMSAEESDRFLKEMENAKYDIYMNRYLISYECVFPIDGSFKALFTVAAVVALIIILTSVYCIKNSFNISITEKIRQYGMLASVGATRRQIKSSVKTEAAMLGVVGIPVGTMSGILASLVLVKVVNALISILKEPKNSLTKQYHRLFELDGVELDFEDDALELVAKKSLERKTGARGLRAIMEGSLMDLMYKIPSDDTIRKCTITKDVVDGTGEPEIVRGETPAQAKTAGSRRTSRTHKKDKPETA